jgi:hypothetical protein
MASKRRSLYAQAVAQKSPPPVRPRVKPRDVRVEHYSPTRGFYDVTSSGDPLYAAPSKGAVPYSANTPGPRVVQAKGQPTFRPPRVRKRRY